MSGSGKLFNQFILKITNVKQYFKGYFRIDSLIDIVVGSNQIITWKHPTFFHNTSKMKTSIFYQTEASKWYNNL